MKPNHFSASMRKLGAVAAAAAGLVLLSGAVALADRDEEPLTTLCDYVKQRVDDVIRDGDQSTAKRLKPLLERCADLRKARFDQGAAEHRKSQSKLGPNRRRTRPPHRTATERPGPLSAVRLPGIF